MRTGLRELLAGAVLILAVPPPGAAGAAGAMVASGEGNAGGGQTADEEAAGKTADEKQPPSPKTDRENASAAEVTTPGTQPSRPVPRAGSRGARKPRPSASSTGAPSASGTTPSSGRQQAPSQKPAPSREPGSRLYTNEDLKKYARPEDRAIDEEQVRKARQEQEAFQSEALKKQGQQPATEAFRAKLRKDAEDRVSSAEKRLAELRQRADAVANPMLPQPELTPEEQAKWKAATREELYAKTQQEIKDAEAELAAARVQLQEVLKNLAAAK